MTAKFIRKADIEGRKNKMKGVVSVKLAEYGLDLNSPRETAENALNGCAGALVMVNFLNEWQKDECHDYLIKEACKVLGYRLEERQNAWYLLDNGDRVMQGSLKTIYNYLCHIGKIV